MPELDLEWRLARVRAYPGRLPLARARAIVFGSVGRGDFVRESDTDVLVLGDDLPAGVRARLDVLGDARDGVGEIELVGWTEAEWRRRLAEGDPFARLVEAEGLRVEVVHDRGR